MTTRLMKRTDSILFRTLLPAVLLLLAHTVMLYGAEAKLRATPTITRGMQQTLPMLAADDIYQHPGLPDTLRVLAIRIDFEEDTLMTTTGDGGFFYELPDTIDSEDWLVDPPPHDSLYFADQLLAMRTYFERFSHGKLSFTGYHNRGPNSGGDIYPLGERAAYHIPYPIWHVNYGNDDNERLNQTLTQLFVDAWNLANEDPEINVSNYDIFLIFHAGAGNEFDTGYDTTPHDIPSVVIGQVDLAEYVNLPTGIPMQNGNILKGAILPETQRQDGIDVGMLGTVCAQVGFLIGMPHLYDTETGDPGIGLLGLMDRGFGGYFGLAPTPPSAWMRAYMGWEDVVTIREGEVRLGALHLPDSVFDTDLTLHRLVRVPINENEYYLLEARRRDPQEDSLTYAYDRDGDRLILNDDYTIELDPSNTGEMTSPISIEDHDFDLPASGMLIWHIDESVIRANIADDHLQNNRDRRAVDLEEADGTEDIGEEYEFLQAGDGAEYGVREDAWYVDNELWRESNNSSFVTFSSSSVPSTDANSGGATHIEITDFSSIGDTMTAIVGNDWRIDGFPETLPYEYSTHVELLTADLDGDGNSEVVICGNDGVIRAYKADGSPISDFDSIYTFEPAGPVFLVAGKVVRQDPEDRLVLAYNNNIVVLHYDTASGFLEVETLVRVDALNFIDLVLVHPTIESLPAYGVDTDHLHVLALSDEEGRGITAVHVDFTDGYRLNYNNLGQSSPRFSHGTKTWIAGNFWSTESKNTPYAEKALIISETGGMALFEDSEPQEYVRLLTQPFNGLRAGEKILEPVSIYHRPGLIAAPTSEGRFVEWRADQNGNMTETFILEAEVPVSSLVPFDVDGDGYAEFSTQVGNTIVGLEDYGLISEGTPINFPAHLGTPEGHPAIVTRFDENPDPYYLTFARDEDKGMISAIDLRDHRAAKGFPLEFGYREGQPSPTLYVDHLDDDVAPYLMILSQPYDTTPARLRVYKLQSIDSRSEFPAWSGTRGNSGGTRAWWIDTTGIINSVAVDLSSSYAWPNPVYDDAVHLRFKSGHDGEVKVSVYDLVGRRMMDRKESFTGSANNDQEVRIDVTDWPSGVYVARLESGDQHTTIRFAVVQ